VNALFEIVLMLGLAAGQEEAAFQKEALADLDRRTGGAEAKKQQEDPRPQRPETPLQDPQAAPGSRFIDFEWLEMNTQVGMAIFSKEYHIDPSPAVCIGARAPILWLAPSDNPDGDYFGAFAELGIAIIKRTIEPAVDKPSGAMISLTVGLDFTIIRNATWLLLVKGGIQYATYGGVTDLEDGMAPMVGLTAGLTVSQSVAITVSPEYVMGRKGDTVMIGYLGVTFDF
jgi:hypothetical protein